MTKNSFLIVFLTRLSPVFPFGILNYAFGTFQVDFATYSVATCLGLIPGNFMYAYLGSQMGDIQEVLKTGGAGDNPFSSIMLLVSVFATLAVIVVVTLVTRRALLDATNHQHTSQPC